MNMSTTLPADSWRTHKKKSWTIRVIGCPEVADVLEVFLNRPEKIAPEFLMPQLAKLSGHFAFIADAPDFTVAATDRARGYPIFFAGTGAGIKFSPQAGDLCHALTLNEPDPVSLLEFLMAGYVTGPNTVYRGLGQLQAGEVVVLDKRSGKRRATRYYEFLPRESGEDERRLLRRLAEATELTFGRLAREAEGRPVIVPLSGGLDSRLVLCMLQAMGVKDLRAISYGPPGNQEALRARIVADRLKVPWKFHPSTRRAARRLFAEPLRREYWRASDGLSSVPNMQEFQVIADLVGSGEIPKGALIVNGQSGDFITGGHVPAQLTAPYAGDNDLFEAVVAKHFSLWKSMKTLANLEALRGRFEAGLSDVRRRGYLQSHQLYEYWEWQERQAKFVVNQQRTYDFFGIGWRLPLWDREYCQLWREVPVKMKLNQALYRKYLRRWDYRGLFTDPKLDRPIVRWPGLSKGAIPLARMAGLAGGDAAKDFVYDRLKYFGHYANQLGCYSYRHYLRRAGEMRNSVSLFAETWLREHFPEWMAEHFPMRG